jgi:hypothetical protein
MESFSLVAICIIFRDSLFCQPAFRHLDKVFHSTLMPKYPIAMSQLCEIYCMDMTLILDFTLTGMKVDVSCFHGLLALIR